MYLISLQKNSCTKVIWGCECVCMCVCVRACVHVCVGGCVLCKCIAREKTTSIKEF